MDQTKNEETSSFYILKIMYKCLVSAGCSFAFGFNLPDRSKRYSQLVADHMGIELYDVSMAGASNEAIASTAVVGLNRALRKFKPEELIILIGWTTTERFEFFHKNHGRIMSAMINHKTHRVGDSDPLLKEVNSFVAEKMWDHSYGYYKLVHAFNYVHSFCRNNNIKVIHKQNVKHHPAYFPGIKLKFTQIKNKHLIESALSPDYKKDFEAWSLHDSCFQDVIMKRRLILRPGFDTHPNEEGHAFWFKHLIASHPSLN